MKTADQILQEASETFKERNAIYKDNYLMVGELMAKMFPNGITLRTPQDHNRFHLLMLKIVKLSRYAINWETGHQPSIHDDCVYSAMLEAADANYLTAPLATEKFKKGTKVYYIGTDPQYRGKTGEVDIDDGGRHIGVKISHETIFFFRENIAIANGDGSGINELRGG